MTAYTYQLWQEDDETLEQKLIGEYSTKEEAEEAAEKKLPLYANYIIVKEYL